MKQFITILSLCLFTMAGTQNAQAQTKEEDLEWLKTNVSLAFVPLKPTYPRDPTGWTEEEWKDNLINLGSRIEVVSQDSIQFRGNFGGGTIKFDEILYEEDLEKMEKMNVDDYHGILFIIKLLNNRHIKYYVSPEKEADVKRVLKAIMHIAKLSGAKENKQIF